MRPAVHSAAAARRAPVAVARAPRAASNARPTTRQSAPRARCRAPFRLRRDLYTISRAAIGCVLRFAGSFAVSRNRWRHPARAGRRAVCFPVRIFNRAASAGCPLAISAVSALLTVKVADENGPPLPRVYSAYQSDDTIMHCILSCTIIYRHALYLPMHSLHVLYSYAHYSHHLYARYSTCALSRSYSPPYLLPPASAPLNQLLRHMHRRARPERIPQLYIGNPI